MSQGPPPGPRETRAPPGEPRRLHPSSLFLFLIEDLRKWILPLVLVLFFSAGQRWELWLMLWIGPNMLYETLRYATMRYRVAGGELVLRQGLLERSERHIPFDRIQNIDLVQGPLQRLLGVAEVRVETASGSEAEGVLRYLALEDVEALRARVFAGRAKGGPSAAEGAPDAAQAAPAPATRLILELSLADLVKLGIVSNRGTAVILAALGLAYELNLRERFPKESFERYVDALEATQAVSLLVLGALGVLALTLLFSVLSTIVRLHGFRLEREGDQFRLRCGLLTRHAATVPRERIQLVTLHESLLQRLFGCASLRIETAGGADEEVATLARRWFVPLIPRARAPEILAELAPGLDPDGGPWRPLAPRARARALRLAAVLALLISAGCAVLSLVLGLALLVLLLPLLLLAAHLDQRFTRWARPAHAVALREGAFHRRTSFTLLSRIHVVRASESPLDRRWRMASVFVDTAGAGTAGHKLRIPWLERDVALGLQRELALEAEAAGFHW